MINNYIPSQSIGATHSLVASSMIVPLGHSQPLAIQMRGHATSPVLLHV